MRKKTLSFFLSSFFVISRVLTDSSFGGDVNQPDSKDSQVASVASVSAGPTKGLLRFRERLGVWKTSLGKEGWSNRPGKVLSCGKESKITYTGQVARPLMDGEAIQIGAELIVGMDRPVCLQSGPGVFHKLLPGTKISVSPLEAGQKDVKITLIEGTILTMLLKPMAAPRISLLALGDGVIVQTGDATYQAVKSGLETRFSVLSGSVRLVEEAGAAQVAQLGEGTTGIWPGLQDPGRLSPDSPEAVSLKQLSETSKEDYLTDMVEDAIKAAAADAELILRESCEADPNLARHVALEALEIRPDLHGLIAQVSGFPDLPLPVDFHAETDAFMKRASPWLRGEPSPTSLSGKVLKVEGKVTRGGDVAVTRSMILAKGETIKTAGDGRVLFLAASGVIAEIQPGSEVKILEMDSRFEDGNFQSAKITLDAPKGQAYLSVAKDVVNRVEAEIRTPKGIAKPATAPAAQTL